MAPPKDIARSYPKRGLTADLGFRSEPTFCSDGAIEFVGYGSGGGPFINYSLNKTFSAFTVASWVLIDGKSNYNYFMQAGSGIGSLGMVSFGWISGTTNPQLRLQDRKSNIAYIPSQAFPEVINQWCHVACTINSAGDSIKMYVNGIEVTGLTQPTSGNEVVMPGSDGASVAHFNVGSFQYGAVAQTLGIGGKMANFGLYDAELTQDQIIQLMRGNDFATCSAVATPAVFFELFENNTDSTGNAGTITDTGTPYYGYAYAQLPRGLDLTRGAAQAKVHTGRSVDFDGTADRLAGATYDGGGTETTMVYWFNADTTSGSTMPFANGGASNSRNQLQTLITSGTLRPMDAPTNIPFSIEAGRWYMLAIVGDSGGLKKAYLDGADGGSPVSYGHSITASQFVIGARNNTPQQLFNGKIAGFKIFDVELTQDQVRELYHNPDRVLPTGVSASNLRRYYPLSDYNDTGGTGGRYFQDMGADGEPLEDDGSSSMAFAQPVPCPQLGLQQSATRLYHPGANQGAAATITAPGTTVSLSAWIFWDQARTSYPIQLGTVTSATDSFNIRINSGGQVTLYQNAEYLSGFTITEGGWNHIVFATRSDSPYWRCWLNNSEASSPAVANVTNITSTDCRLGMNSSNFGMGGIANDAAVWNTELGDSDVAALYNSGVQGMDVGTVQASNLKGWWKFDDLTTLKDYSGNSANATVTGTFAAASFPENASGSTIVGDFSMKRKGVSVLNLGAVDSGADEYALSAKDSAFLPSFANGGSFSCFFRLQKLGEYSSIFINDDYNSGTQHRFAAYVTNANKLQLELGDGASARANPITTATISDSEWHHFAFTVGYGGGSTTTIKLFLDGALESTSTATTLAGVPNATALRFGDYVTSSTNEANGPIACLKFYQVTLSDNEIKQIYNSDLRLIKGLQNE